MNLFARKPKSAERSDRLAVAVCGGDTKAFHELILFHRPLARKLSKQLCRRNGRVARAEVVARPGRRDDGRSPGATGISNHPVNGGALEKARQITNPESAPTTKPYDRRGNKLSLDEVERITV